MMSDFFREEERVWELRECSKQERLCHEHILQTVLLFASKRLHSHIVSWKLIQSVLRSLLHFFRTILKFVLHSNNKNNNNNNGKTTTIIVVKCVTWYLYFGRPGETSEYRLLWLWTKANMILDWRSSTLDITTAGIVGISHCLWSFGYCTVLMLAVLTDGRWKLAATHCNNIRYWHDAVDRPRTFYTLQNAQQQHCKHHSDSGQQVSSLH